MNTFKISIIIPTYRSGNQLNKLIACLQAQTIGFSSLEILFADDCSPDDTGALLDTLAERWENVSALHAPANSGFAGAPRNMAMRAAHAPYVMFLDADDLLPPSACSLLYEEMLSQNVDLVTGYCRRISPSGTVVQPIAPPYASIPAHISILPKDLDVELVMRDSFFCRLYKRNIIEAHRLFFPERTPGEDIYFLYSYLLQCQKVSYIAQHVYDYYINEASVTHNRTADYYIQLGHCYKSMQMLFETADQSAHFPTIVDHILEFHLCGMLDSSDMDEAAIASALPAWRWLFDYELALGQMELSPFACTLWPFISRAQWQEAAHLLVQCAPFKRALELEHAKTQAAFEEAETWKKHANGFHQSLEAVRSSRSWRLIHPFQKK